MADTFTFEEAVEQDSFSFEDAFVPSKVGGPDVKASLRAEQRKAARTGALANLAGDVTDFLTGGVTGLTFSPSAIIGQIERGTGLDFGLARTMQTPIVQIPEIPTKAETPLAGKLAAGVGNAAIELANFFLTPEGIAMMGISGLPEQTRRTVTAAWSGQLLAASPERFNNALEAARKGDYATAAKETTAGLGQPVMAGALGRASLEPVKSLKVPTQEEALAALAERKALAGTMPSRVISPVVAGLHEQQLFAPPPLPEAPPGMVVENLPPKFSQVVGKGDIRFLEPPESLPQPEPTPKVQLETRGKVSFGAGAPILLREAIGKREEPQPAAPEAGVVKPEQAALLPDTAKAVEETAPKPVEQPVKKPAAEAAPSEAPAAPTARSVWDILEERGYTYDEVKAMRPETRERLAQPKEPPAAPAAEPGGQDAIQIRKAEEVSLGEAPGVSEKVEPQVRQQAPPKEVAPEGAAQRPATEEVLLTDAQRLDREAYEARQRDEAAFRAKQEREARGEKFKPKENLPQLVKRLGRYEVNRLVGEWEGDAQLSPDGKFITTFTDPRNQTGRKRVPVNDFLEWMEGQEATKAKEPWEMTSIQREDGGVYIVASSAGKEAGSAIVKNLGDGVFELNEVKVNPSSRRKGLGQEIYKSAADEVKKLGGKLYTSPELTESGKALVQSLDKAGLLGDNIRLKGAFRREVSPTIARKGMETAPEMKVARPAPGSPIGTGLSENPIAQSKYIPREFMRDRSFLEAERNRILQDIDDWRTGKHATPGQPASGKNYQLVMRDEIRTLDERLNEVNALLTRASIKEPWQMTQKEWLTPDNWDLSPAERHIGRKFYGSSADKQAAIAYHKFDVIERALREGKPVPAEVLADYPDLAKPAEPAPPPAAKPAEEVPAPNFIAGVAARRPTSQVGGIIWDIRHGRTSGLKVTKRIKAVGANEAIVWINDVPFYIDNVTRIAQAGISQSPLVERGPNYPQKQFTPAQAGITNDRVWQKRVSKLPRLGLEDFKNYVREGDRYVYKERVSHAGVEPASVSSKTSSATSFPQVESESIPTQSEAYAGGASPPARQAGAMTRQPLYETQTTVPEGKDVVKPTEPPPPSPTVPEGPGAGKRRKTLKEIREQLDKDKLGGEAGFINLSPIANAVDRLRDQIGIWFDQGHVKKAMSVAKDRANNMADKFANEVGNRMNNMLLRALKGTILPSQRERLMTVFAPWKDANELYKSALTVGVESFSDALPNSGEVGVTGPARLALQRTKLQAYQPPDATMARWKDKALAAIDYAIANWNRLEPVVQRYMREMNAQADFEQTKGVDTLKRNGYVMHETDLGGKSRFDFLNPRGGGEGAIWMKNRVYPTYVDKIIGNSKPVSMDAIALGKARLRSGQRKVNNAEWTQNLRNTLDPISNKPILTDATEQTRQDGSHYYTPIDEDYTLARIGYETHSIHKGYAGAFEALTDPSWFSKSLAGQSLMKIAGTTKHIVLAFDTFHLGRLAFWASILQKKPAGYKKGLVLLNYDLMELREMARRGEIPREYMADIVENKRKIGLAMETGFNVARVQDALWQDWTQKIPGTGAFQKWLFSEFQQGAMIESWLAEFARQKKSFSWLSEEQVARQVSKDLNTRFGNLQSQGWFKSKTAQDLARLIFLAPQWNEGLIMSELKGLHGAGKTVYDAATRRKIAVSGLTRAAGIMMLAQFAANQLINMTTRGHPTWENKEDGLDAKLSAYLPDYIGDGPGLFLSPLALPAETAHLLYKLHERTGDMDDAINSYARSRLGTVTRPVATWAFRKDAFGRTIRSEDLWKEIVKSATPVPISGGAAYHAARQLATGERAEQFAGQFQKQALASGGVKTESVPTASQQIGKLARKWNEARGKLPPGEFYSSPYTDLDRLLRAGNTRDAVKKLDDLLTKKDVDQIFKRYEFMGEMNFTHSSEEDEADFFNSLTKDQKQAYLKARMERTMLADKFYKLWAIREARGKK